MPDELCDQPCDICHGTKKTLGLRWTADVLHQEVTTRD